MTPDEFRQANPSLYFLHTGEVAGLAAYLRGLQVLDVAEEILQVTKAGEGNMNCVVRVTTDRRSFIVKQSRPWVEKYPQFEAPWDRACREIEFYELVRSFPAVARYLPDLIRGDPKSRVLVLEDLGTGGDYTGVYQGLRLGTVEMDCCAEFLTSLHALFVKDASRPALPNREMRALNHRHIFVLPLTRDNGLDLESIQAGLTAPAEALRGDDAYRAEVMRLGSEVYLAEGPCLLHGDFFPGSFVRTAAGPRVIDPEFCFFGAPEYDVGILLGHLFLSGQPAELRQRFRDAYRAENVFDDLLMLQLAGVEIMRRILGYAQLPMLGDLAWKARLLDLSRELVLHPRTVLLTADVPLPNS